MCQCNAPLENIAFCSQCGALTKLSLTSPFKAFGLPGLFNVDLALLNHTYLKLQKKLHPDRFVDNPEEKELAQGYSSYINSAYQLLRDPIQRADLLLQDFPPISLSHQSLMDQMEKREYLNSISSSAKDLFSFAQKVRQEIDTRENQMSLFFENKEMEKAAYCLGHLKYLYRLKQEILVREERL